jgi:hypothetical protein
MMSMYVVAVTSMKSNGFIGRIKQRFVTWDGVHVRWRDVMSRDETWCDVTSVVLPALCLKAACLLEHHVTHAILRNMP